MQGGGLFGNTSTPQPAGGGLFGTSTGGLFGNTTSNNTQAPTNTTGTSSLFGNSGGTGLFSTTTPSSGTGLFGNTATSGGGGLFGTGTTSNTGGGLFGSTGTGGGLFGSGNTGGGLFGSTNAASSGTNSLGRTGTTGGLFGGGTSNTTTGGLFGSQGQNTSGGLFGTAQPTGGLFGSTPTQNTSGGLFGNTQGGLFGTSNTGAFGSTSSTGQQPLIGRQKPGDPPTVTLSTRPTVRDFARLHPDNALLIQELHEWFQKNEEALDEIKTSFEDVEKICNGAYTSSIWKASDANVLMEGVERAEELLNYVRPSVTRLAETTECLRNDFARLDTGVVTVPPVEHGGLLEEFWEKKELLERYASDLTRAMDALDETRAIGVEEEGVVL